MSGRVLVAAVLLGFAAFWLACGVGIPAWRAYEPGDATDIGVSVGVAVMLLASRRRPA